MSQLLPIIGIDLTQVGDQYIKATGTALWLPPKILQPITGGRGFQLYTQVTDAIVGIAFNDDQELLPFGVADSLANSYVGRFTKLRARVIVPSATGNAVMYFHAGIDVTVGYGNTDGLSPDIGAPTVVRTTDHTRAPFLGS